MENALLYIAGGLMMGLGALGAERSGAVVAALAQGAGEGGLESRFLLIHARLRDRGI